MPSVTPCQNCDSSGVTFGPAWLKSPAIQEHTIRSGADMADSDRSRSPVHARNRPDQRSARPPVQLPGFPRWRGPMGAGSLFDDPHRLYFDSLHHGFNFVPFSRLPYHPNQNDGTPRPPRTAAKSEVEINFGRLHQHQSPMGLHSQCA